MEDLKDRQENVEPFFECKIRAGCGYILKSATGAPTLWVGFFSAMFFPLII